MTMWIKQVLVRAFYIYLALHAIAFLFIAFMYVIAKSPNFNVSYTGDPFKGIFFCLLVSGIVQLFQKPNRQAAQSRQTYLDVVTELLNGDRAAAIRLFNYNKEKFGGKTDEWLWQKVIRDIERDRR